MQASWSNSVNASPTTSIPTVYSTTTIGHGGAGCTSARRVLTACPGCPGCSIPRPVPTSRPSRRRCGPVTVVVTTTLAELDGAARAAVDSSIPMPAAARTGGGSRLPMRDLIGMAAKAIHYLAVFEDHTERPLYLGRQKRVATADQRLICYAYNCASRILVV